MQTALPVGPHRQVCVREKTELVSEYEPGADLFNCSNALQNINQHSALNPQLNTCTSSICVPVSLLQAPLHRRLTDEARTGWANESFLKLMLATQGRMRVLWEAVQHTVGLHHTQQKPLALRAAKQTWLMLFRQTQYMCQLSAINTDIFSVHTNAFTVHIQCKFSVDGFRVKMSLQGKSKSMFIIRPRLLTFVYLFLNRGAILRQKS